MNKTKDSSRVTLPSNENQPTSKGGYIATIGIECHTQMSTQTKLFSSVANDARDALPNTLTSHICFGMPGALPVLNKKAVEYAIRVAIALNTEPQKFSFFERKHYFYPDLPKGYQITQLAKPIIIGGTVAIIVNNQTKTVRINRVQIEEDAGKSTHPSGSDYSLVDLNRAGTPLFEVVSEADMHSAAEAKAYARELWLLMRYIKVSDADLYHGNMRFDVNVSVSKNPKLLGIRTETKNLNSFRSVEKAVEFEINRQIELLDKGEKIIQETRGWDDAKQKTFSQRTKEDSHDYRYFPDPDLPPILLDNNTIGEVKNNMPVLPKDLRKKLLSIGLNSQTIETLIEAIIPANLMYGLLDNGCSTVVVKRVSNWLVTEVQALVANANKSWESLLLNPKDFVRLSTLVEENKISSSAAKTVLLEVIGNGGDIEEIAKRLGLLQMSDENALLDIVKKVVDSNVDVAKDIKNGEMKAIGFLVGQVMKQSKGSANPKTTQDLIKKYLDI